MLAASHTERAPLGATGEHTAAATAFTVVAIVGFVDGWHKVGRKFWPGVQAAAYLSSYFIGGRHHKAQITENILAGDLPRLVVFVSRDLTRTTGCTMRSLRNVRRLWASRQGLIERPSVTLEEWLAAAAMLDTRRRE